MMLSAVRLTGKSCCRRHHHGSLIALTARPPHYYYLDITRRNNSTDTKATLYEGPFAALTLRLKRVSISTAVVSLVGIPLLIKLHGGDVPATGQLAVGGTALLAATGSTVAMSFCFSPYVHTLEKVVIRKCSSSGQTEEECEEEELPEFKQQCLIKATTRNILGMKVETVFDPITDVERSNSSRPFCNLQAKGMPLYIHPELLYNEPLRTQLLSVIQDPAKEEQQKEFAKQQKQDDDFL